MEDKASCIVHLSTCRLEVIGNGDLDKCAHYVAHRGDRFHVGCVGIQYSHHNILYGG